MKALTISQPYASLIASGEKWVENRTWPTAYRGLIAIHAGKGTQYLTRREMEEQKLPTGWFDSVIITGHVSPLKDVIAIGIPQSDDGTKTFETGAVRSTDADNVAYHLISPVAVERIAMVMQRGAKKYTPFNWERGMPADEMINHAIRHLFKFLAADVEEDHLAHALFNVMGAIHSLAKWPELNQEFLESLAKYRAETDSESIKEQLRLGYAAS